MASGAVIAAWAAVAVSSASLAYSVYSGEQQKSSAKKAAEAQQAQYEAEQQQAALERAEAKAEQRRQARISQAKVAASSGAVGGGSIFEAAETSAETQATAAIDYIEQTGELQDKQYALASDVVDANLKSTVSAANASIFKSFASLASSVNVAAETSGWYDK